MMSSTRIARQGADERLRTQLFDPLIHREVHLQSIRNAHVHRAEFYGSEFVRTG